MWACTYFAIRDRVRHCGHVKQADWDYTEAKRAHEGLSLKEAAVTLMESDTAATEKRKGITNHWKRHFGGRRGRNMYDTAWSTHDT